MRQAWLLFTTLILAPTLGPGRVPVCHGAAAVPDQAVCVHAVSGARSRHTLKAVAVTETRPVTPAPESPGATPVPLGTLVLSPSPPAVLSVTPIVPAGLAGRAATGSPALPTPLETPVAAAVRTVSRRATPIYVLAEMYDLPAVHPGVLSSYHALQIYKSDWLAPLAGTDAWYTLEVRYNSRPLPDSYRVDVRNLDKGAQVVQQLTRIVWGGDTYLYVPEHRQWLRMPAGKAGPGMSGADLLNPDRLVEAIPPGLFSRSHVVSALEQIDGVYVVHYRARSGLLLQWLRAEAGGRLVQAATGRADFWIATNGGYLKRYELDAVVEYRGGQQAHLLSQLSVTEENRIAEIPLPPADVVVDPGSLLDGQGLNTPAAPPARPTPQPLPEGRAHASEP